jgi:hypothetical protein
LTCFSDGIGASFYAPEKRAEDLMSKGLDYDYHVERARAEMDCAYWAEGDAAATAHMKLSALHMDRARSARGYSEPAAPHGEARRQTS